MIVRSSLRVLVALALNTHLCAHAQQAARLSGVVLDSAGDVIANATVEVGEKEHVVRTHTDEKGRFAIRADSRPPTMPIHLIVSAEGFATARVSVAPGLATPIEIRLVPTPLIERITITATAETSGEVPGQTSIDRTELSHSGAVTFDDALRQAPGFSLFRRAGSLTANPTTQGVSLRGIGASGASRALVLLDGVPLNSPFGGWVYWNRVPPTSIATANVINGAASDTFGSGALGGVVNIESRPAAGSFFDAEVSAGNRATAAASVSAGTLVRDWEVDASMQVLHTDGYVLVPESERGTVDTAAGTADIGGSMRLSRTFRNGGRLFVRPASFGESRRNGTPLQNNDTRISSIDLGLDWPTVSYGDFSARAYGSREIFNQTFSAIAADRRAESLTNRQRNPSQQIGAALQWRRLFFARHLIVAGAEARDVRGHSAEVTFNNSRTTATIDAGGRQRTVAAFGQDSIRARGWLLTFGGRIDRWLNYRGFSRRLPVTGAPALVDFSDVKETAFSPRVSIAKTFDRRIAISGSLYRAFRAPTLNELYRGFRVGNIVTNANSELRGERLTGGEAGVSLRTFSEYLTIRGSAFWSDIRNPIANVTISSAPNLITRQRQNAGVLRARGVELSTETKLEHLNLAAQYLFSDSTVLRFPTNRSLEGLFVPQVPRHQFNFQISYDRDQWSGAAQGRTAGSQFEDDQNTLRLGHYVTLDLHLARTLSSRLKIFVAAQNVTGARYEVGRTPVLTVGPPVLVRIGARITLP